MKLVELLARELKAWPDGAEFYCQDYNRNAYPYEVKPERHEHRDVLWGCKGQLSGVSAAVLSDIASDNATAIVTRADWSAERARIAKPAKKAGKDGWIRHRGGKCPVDAGTAVDVRFRSGDIDTDKGWPIWTHNGGPRDIMAYRLHKPAEQVEASSKPELQIKLPENYGEIIGGSIEGPLKWRDRISEIDVEVQARTVERAELVQKLASEGFALIGRVVEPVEDMSDWRNWKAGDLIQCTDDMGTYLTSGNCYVFERMEEGSVIIKEDDDGDESGASLHKMKFHSRPSA